LGQSTTNDKQKQQKSNKKTHTHPYNLIKTTKNATILGKVININNNNGKTVQHRLQKAKQAWRQLKRKIFTNQTLHTKIRILMWNAAIRAILTYGLQTRELKPTQYEKMEQFMFTSQREMVQPDWIQELKKNIILAIK